jgi:hypothetical protein
LKIKTGFVTNSSSVHFYIQAPHKITKEDLGLKIKYDEEFEVFNDIEGLISACQNEKCDWIDLARGTPKRFYYFWHEEFEMLKEIVKENQWAGYVKIDRNDYDRIQDFKENLINMGGTIVKTEHE